MAKERKNPKKRIKLRLIPVVLLLALILGAGYYFRDSLKGLTSFLPVIGSKDRITYSGHAEKRYGEINGNLVVASAKGVQVIDRAGNKLLNKAFDITSPALSCDGSYAIIYDIGGKTAKVFQKDDILYEITSETFILSADVSEKGTAVIVEDCQGYNGMVSYYGKDGKVLMQWFSGESYVMGAKLSPDGKTIAALGITEKGSRIVFLEASTGNELGSFSAEGEVFIDIQFKSNSTVSAVGKERLLSIKKDGTVAGEYSYEGMTLRQYEFGEKFDVVILSSYQVGDVYTMATLNGSKEIKKAEIAGNIADIDINGWEAAIYSERDITVYSRSCEVKRIYEDKIGLDGIIYLGGKLAGLGSYYAEIL